MNCETCQLKELVVAPLEIRDVLRCILHTIVFHRALGLVRPKDVDCELFEITYVQCGDAELEKKIDEKIDLFIGWVEKHPNKKSQVCLSFYEVRNKQATWMFSNKTERLYWEQWYINLHVINPKSHGKSHSSKAPINSGDHALEESSSRRASLESALREALFQIIKFVNEKKDHIPSITNSEVVSFPYEITTPRCLISSRTIGVRGSGASYVHMPLALTLLNQVYFVKKVIHISGSPGDTFSFDVLHSSSDSSFGWHADVLKRMLQTGHPSMLS